MNEFRVETSHITDISFFCNYEIQRGDFVFSDGLDWNTSASLVKPFKDAKASDILIGMSMHNVVLLDLTKQHIDYNRHQVQKGGKINILKSGIITTVLNKKWKLPSGQLLYLNSKGNLTWRYGLLQVGTVIKKQERNGSVRVSISC